MTYSELNQLLSCTVDGVAYIANPIRLEQNIRHFDSAVKAVYPRSRMGYSYKTNYLPFFCRLAHSMGMYAEVVSGMEYQLARYLDIDHEQIIFNGPDKKAQELELALLNGAVLNVDSLEEVNRITQILKQYPNRTFKLGARCLYGKFKGAFPSRFGLDYHSGELMDAIRLIRNIPNCTLAGLHCHSSYDRSASSYAERARFMIEIADSIFEEPPEYIDIGGGFCGELPESIRRQRGDAPSYEEYAATIGTIFREHYGKEGIPELILEPGVGLIADAMSYACRVTAIKQQSNRSVAIVSGSIEHLKIVPNDVNLPVKVFSANPKRPSTYHQQIHLTGFTCLEHDILYADYAGTVDVDDIVVFDNAGAYSISASPSFIRTTPPVFVRQRAAWLKVAEQMDASQLFSLLDSGNPRFTQQPGED